MLDIDHFKLYNDLYGHPAGDACLRTVAQALAATALRPTDLLARYGGEEFALLLPLTPCRGAEHLVQRLVRSIARLALPHDASPTAPHVTISAGASCCDDASVAWLDRANSVNGDVDSAERASAEGLVSAADKALYAAKHAGRAQAMLLDMADEHEPARARRISEPDRLQTAPHDHVGVRSRCLMPHDAGSRRSARRRCWRPVRSSAPSSTARRSPASPPMRTVSSRSSTSAPSACSARCGGRHQPHHAADISDPAEVVAHAAALSVELGTLIEPGVRCTRVQAARSLEDIYELTYVRKDGTRFPAIVSVTPLRDPIGVIIGYLLIGTDNSARKQAEHALRENTALLRTIHLHSIVSVTDRAGRIVEVNDSFCRISGYSRAELIGQTHSIVNSRVQEHAFWVQMWRTIASGEPWRGDICNRAKDGSLYWVDSIIVPFVGEDGRTTKYISIRTDITRRKRAEFAMTEAAERAERANREERVPREHEPRDPHPR